MLLLTGDIDDCISSLLTSMLSKKISKLLPFLGVRSRHYYCIEVEEVIQYQTFPELLLSFGVWNLLMV